LKFVNNKKQGVRLGNAHLKKHYEKTNFNFN
jgi:hypothetical protein